jgi:hypothetical protein
VWVVLYLPMMMALAAKVAKSMGIYCPKCGAKGSLVAKDSELPSGAGAEEVVSEQCAHKSYSGAPYGDGSEERDMRCDECGEPKGERERFEAWASTVPDYQLMRNSEGRDRESYTQEAWCGWLARADLVGDDLAHMQRDSLRKAEINVALGEQLRETRAALVEIADIARRALTA